MFRASLILFCCPLGLPDVQFHRATHIGSDMTLVYVNPRTASGNVDLQLVFVFCSSIIYGSS